MLQSAELGTVRLAGGWDVPGLEEEEGSGGGEKKEAICIPDQGKVSSPGLVIQ